MGVCLKKNKIIFPNETYHDLMLLFASLIVACWKTGKSPADQASLPKKRGLLYFWGLSNTMGLKLVWVLCNFFWKGETQEWTECRSTGQTGIPGSGQGPCRTGPQGVLVWYRVFGIKFYRSRSDKPMHAEYFWLNSAWPSPAPCLWQAHWKQPFEVREIWVTGFNRNCE